MPAFGTRSMEHLVTCAEPLQRLSLRVVSVFDCSCIEGHRGAQSQNDAFDAGLSQLRWPKSKHNKIPSDAIHLVPYPLDWEDRDRFHYFAGYVRATAWAMGIGIRWGGDWDGDWQTRDNAFDDLAHFELLRED